VTVDRTETLVALWRAKGGRVTGPRRAILEALANHGGHPTAEELTRAVQQRQPDVHQSTVYRFLDELERLNVVDHVHLGHGPAVYHFVDDTHHHLVCEACGEVTEAPAAAFAALRKRLQTDFAFEMDPRHFAVLGRCAACAAASGPPTD
jgi:Fe2+ or Zn2+ uptake regulation protein